MSNDTWDEPATTVGIPYADVNGALTAWWPSEVVKDFPTSLGNRDAIRCTRVVVVDGPLAGTVYEDTLVFPKVLQGALRARIGGQVLGRLGQGVAKPGQNAPWVIAAATPEDKVAASAMVTKLQSQSFSDPAPAAADPGASAAGGAKRPW